MAAVKPLRGYHPAMDEGPRRRPQQQLAVVGGAQCSEPIWQIARLVGEHIARSGAILLCGGRGGVMAAASEGARSQGGRVIGLLPGGNAAESPPNPHLSATIFTGMGQARNQILVLSAGAVVAVGGGWGTLSEIALALKHQVPVVTLESWQLSRPDGLPEPLLHSSASPEGAVRLALELAEKLSSP